MFTDLLVVIGMITLRVGVPLLVIAGIGYFLKRLDRRWEAEAHDYAAKLAAEQPEAPAPAERPAVPVRPPKPAPSPVPQMPFIVPPPATKDQRVQVGLRAAAPQACWDAKGCSSDKKAQCAAPQHPEQPCWQARFAAEGHIPEDCVSCDIFQRYPTV